ncbi:MULTISPECIES: succinyl-diaminopimelate desuccinylase [Candidatus Ichthyocystis]|uniref:succinyl-diaminopimelate desuccinylase n=1 Tax=Candidatus Ichthyocystis TaxID=2929841 RepID=UPI000AB2DAF6|nr:MULTISPECIES: succinyl-diaminopimelate desuccinylase [Ichthyocystis]
MNKVLELSKELIACPSVSPEDAGCQDIIISRLEKSGFFCRRLNYGNVKNFWATHGKGSPCICFAGHTDVVPVGLFSEWSYPPFDPVVSNGYLYGRGACDMKTGLAALVVAAEDFVTEFPDHSGTICFLVTSDEESYAIDGTAKVVKWLKEQNVEIDFCLVGEPVSLSRIGDRIKNGARGSLSCNFTVSGTQGHVSYENANNACHNALAFLTNLVSHHWDCGNNNFQKTSLQITNIKAGVGVDNVVPGSCYVAINIRYCPDHHESDLKAEIDQIILDTRVTLSNKKWVSGAIPFYSNTGYMSEVLSKQTELITGYRPVVNTKGGASDGRFIVDICREVVEFGVVGDTAHQVDERVLVSDVDILVGIYRGVLDELLSYREGVSK